MVISTPHSGTGTLKTFLRDQGHFHFGRHDRRIPTFRGAINIPIRDPVDIVLSWAGRYGGTSNGPFDVDELECLDRMWAYIDNPPNGANVTLYKVEDIPFRKNTGTPSTDLSQPRIMALKAWLTPELRARYAKYYELRI